MLPANLPFDFEELHELDLILQRGLSSCRMGLRHTFSQAYQQLIRERMHRLAAMLEAVESALPEPAPEGVGAGREAVSGVQIRRFLRKSTGRSLKPCGFPLFSRANQPGGAESFGKDRVETSGRGGGAAPEATSSKRIRRPAPRDGGASSRPPPALPGG
jgi:hypothetical protein